MVGEKNDTVKVSETNKVNDYMQNSNTLFEFN